MEGSAMEPDLEDGMLEGEAGMDDVAAVAVFER